MDFGRDDFGRDDFSFEGIDFSDKLHLTYISYFLPCFDS